RVYVVEVMGRDSGYLAMMSGLATGAERVYLPEEGITLADLKRDVTDLCDGFIAGKRLGLMIRSEKADPYYTTSFLATLFEKEGGELFDVRQTILGHTQQGGSPTPYDRIQANRLATRAMLRLIELADSGQAESLCIGRAAGQDRLHRFGTAARSGGGWRSSSARGRLAGAQRGGAADVGLRSEAIGLDLSYSAIGAGRLQRRLQCLAPE
ncbi:MAG: 6-phosphofructokinase, partial [Anaerolineae bacterium]